MGRRIAGLWSSGWPRRLALLLLGLACFSLGLVVTLQSQVGLGPWDVFHQGVSRRLGISFGTASIAVGFMILLLAWALGIGPAVGVAFRVFGVKVAHKKDG
jgi:uncharacterized membrane protein YczE